MAILDYISQGSVLELLRVVWMEVAIACFAATIYFTLTGYFTPRGKKANQSGKCEDVKQGDRRKTSPRGSTTDVIHANCQDITKALRQGNISDAIAQLRVMPQVSSGCVPVNVAPRLLMAVAKASDFDEMMVEMGTFNGKFESRSFEAAVLEAFRSKDIETCHRLHMMAGILTIYKSQQSMELLAHVYNADVANLRLLVEESEAPLSRHFAKVVLEACTALKEVDLALEVFEKVTESDAAVLRKVVERAATNPSGSSSDTVSKDVAVYAKEIRACGKNGDLQGAMEIFERQARQKHSLLYNSVLEACVTCGDLAKAEEIFEQAKKNGCAEVVGYNTVIKGQVAKGNAAAAKALLTELCARGMCPTHASFHPILNLIASAGDRAAVWKLLADMQNAGVRPNAVTCSILLRDKLNTPADVDKVLSILGKIEEPLDEVLLTALAEACIRTKKLEVLAKYMLAFSSQEKSTALGAPTYGSMIKAFGQIHDVKRVKDLWADMRNCGVQPTAVTLGCMVEALVMNKCTADAWELAQQLRSDDTTAPLVNTVIYSTILKGFANAKEIDKVMALYNEMKAHDIQPNNITYNTILNAFAQNGAMHRVPALLEDMKASIPPAEPDIVTYSTIVKGFCNNGNLDRALCIVRDMQEDGKIIPDELMYNSLLDGCAKEHRLDDALQLIKDMKADGVAPSNYTLSIMVKLLGRCRRLKQAFSLVEDVCREYKLRINIQVYTCLIQACFNNRQAAKAVALHDQIIGEGLVPDEIIYSALVKGCVQASMIDKAVHLVKCAHGVASPKAQGRHPGISARCLDDLVSALGGAQSAKAKSLLEEIGQWAVRSDSRSGNGSRQGKALATAPWRK